MIMACMCAFTACSDGETSAPNTPPTQSDFESAMEFNYDHFQFVVTTETEAFNIAYKIDGDIFYAKSENAQGKVVETYYEKQGEQYFEYQKEDTATVWQRNALTQEVYQEYKKEATCGDFAEYFTFDAFEYDSSKKALVAETCGNFTDVEIYISKGKVTKVTYTRNETYIFNFTYTDTALTVPTDIITINSDAWEQAFSFWNADFSYTLKVGEETTTVTVDGYNVRHQKSVGEQDSTLTTVFKDDSGYYKLTPYTYWEENFTHVVYAWEDYYQKVSMTEQEVINLINAYVDYLPAFSYSDFTFNKENNNFTASSITIREKQYTDVIIAFDDYNNLEKVEYAVIDGSDATNVSIDFTFGDMAISKPDNIITYVYPVPESYEDSFSLTSNNYIGIYEDYTYYGYLKPNRTKIEKVGNKICLSEMTYNDDDFTSVTYYDKDGDNYYKYAKVNDIWYKIRITERAYNEVLNIMLSTVLKINNSYSYNFLSQGANNYSIPGGGDEYMLNIFHIDYKVARIVAGGMYNDAYKYPKMQFFFDYGTANITIPESQTAPYEVQLSEDWKTFFYRENYMDFTATIVSGDGKTSIYQSDYTNGTQTVYIKVNSYSNSFEKAMQKTVDGKYTYKEKKSYGWTTSTATVNSRDEELKAQFESLLNYTYTCPDFSNYFSYFTYNDDKGIFEFNGSQTSTLYVQGIFGHSMFSLKYASIEFDYDDRLSKVVIETNDSTPKKYTITFSKYDSTSVSLPS